MKKTQVFNVIILDRSGSMSRIREAAVDGFNETLAGIKKAQEKFADTQDHFVTLVTFCNCETKHVFDKVPVAEARPLTMEDYQPCCGTPLYDAMGFTLTAMRRHVKEIEDSVVVVTVITDGMENSSREYSGRGIKELVERLRGSQPGCRGGGFEPLHPQLPQLCLQPRGHTRFDVQGRQHAPELFLAAGRGKEAGG